MSAPAAVSAPAKIDGTAPHGAWWVAFRLQRSTVLVGLGVMAVMAGAVLWHRINVLNVYVDNGADLTACQALTGEIRKISSDCADLLQQQTDLFAPWQLLKTIWVVLPSIIGAASGATLLAREFERRTQVFALAQSVGTLRWFVTKVVVGLVPLVLCAIGVGFLFESTANAYGPESWTPIGAPNFSDFGFVPGAVLLVSFALGAGVSTVLRLSLGAVLASVVAALGLLWCLVFGYQDLGSVERITSTQLGQAQFSPSDRAQFIESGFLDASGRELAVSHQCTSWEGDLSEAEINRLYFDCYAGQGATQSFADYLPLSSRAPLTWTVAGISAALSALFLTIGYALLRRRTT